MHQSFKAGSISWSSRPYLFAIGSNCVTYACNIADLMCNKITTDCVLVPLLTPGMAAPQDLVIPPLLQKVDQIPSASIGSNCQIIDPEVFTINLKYLITIGIHYRRNVPTGFVSTSA